MEELRNQFSLFQKEIHELIGVNRNIYKDYKLENRTIPIQIL